MWTWIWRLFLVAFLGSYGYSTYKSYRMGYFSLPQFSQTSYAISFRSGLRAILVDPEVSKPLEDYPDFMLRLTLANPDRRYVSVLFDVPAWFEDTWSFCYPPTDEERASIDRDMSDDVKRQLIGARFEALCKIEVDETTVWRGLVYSVPR